LRVANALRTDPDGNKLLILTSASISSKPYTIWASLIGITLLMIAAYGADQDLTQRMLTCKSPRKASWSVIIATLIGLPVVFIFLAMGMLLYVYFQRPDLMGEAMPAYAIDDSRQVFLNYIINDMPIGLRGFMMAGCSRRP
jgi:solute:Na+ symporter, SSS family